MAEDIFDYSIKQDEIPAPRAWVQWKNVETCMDVHCSCGSMYHVDGYGIYFWECPDCGQRYAVGQNVKLIPIPKEMQDQAGEFTVGGQ